MPYLYTSAEIASLMAAARTLRSPLPAATYETLVGLLATTGIRVGETIALGRDDVEVERGLLTIRAAKFGKDRIVPMHPSTVEALQRYAECRDARWPACRAGTFFVSTVGTALPYSSVRVVFARLAEQAGLARHGRRGEDVQARLPLPSTYLGHVKPTSTYWYLSATPELLGLAAGRLDARGGTAMTALAPTLEAFFTAGWPTSGEPARTRSPPIATP